MEKSKKSDVKVALFENQKNRLNALKKLLESTNLKTQIKPGEFVAVKIHFGELGNTSYIKPLYIKEICEFLLNLGAKVFLTDTNTLNGDTRLNSVDHLNCAYYKGTNYYCRWYAWKFM